VGRIRKLQGRIDELKKEMLLSAPAAFGFNAVSEFVAPLNEARQSGSSVTPKRAKKARHRKRITGAVKAKILMMII